MIDNKPKVAKSTEVVRVTGSVKKIVECFREMIGNVSEEKRMVCFFSWPRKLISRNLSSCV